MKQKDLEAIHAVTPPHEPMVLALADIAYQLTRLADREDEDQVDLLPSPDTKPAPDVVGLVEAVKHVIDRLKADFSQKDAIFYLESALDAYKPEVDDE